MTQASMDVGNIISIVIPESPDANIDIDQLTSDFRRQLERIRKQNRANKLEHGLVTLKNVLPDMSKEEKKKTMPLIRRVLGSRRPHQTKSDPKVNRLQKKHTVRTTRRHSGPVPNNKEARYQKNTMPRSSSVPRTDKYQKYIGQPEKYFQTRMNDEQQLWNNRQMQYPSRPRHWGNEPPHNIKLGSPGSFIIIPPKTEESEVSSVTPCPEANESKIRNTKDARFSDLPKQIPSNDCTPVMDADGQIYCFNSPNSQNSVTTSSETFKADYDTASFKDLIPNGTMEKSEQKVYPIDIEVDDLKGIERIIQNPQNVLDQFNVSDHYLATMAVDDNSPSRKNNQANENLQNAVILTGINQEEQMASFKDPRNVDEFTLASKQMAYQNNMQRPTKITQQVHFDDENVEIRIQRSVDDNLLLKGTIINTVK